MNTEDMASLYGTPIWGRLRMYRNPIRMLFSAGVWASAWYLFSSLVLSIVLFCVITSITVTSGALVIIWAGLPLLVGTAYFIRGCVVLERGRARAVVPEGLPALPPVPTAEGFFPTLKAVWRERITQRGLAHFTVLALPLFLLDTVVWTIWVALLEPSRSRSGGATSPRTTTASTCTVCSSATSPTVRTARARSGLIGSDLSATVAAAAGLVLVLAWNYVLVATARVHTNSVRAVVAGRDPMAAARRVLAAPGPLSTSAGA